MKRKDTCNTYKPLFEKCIDNELPEKERRLLMQHIQDCSGCARELAQLRQVDKIGSLKAFPDPGDRFWAQQRRDIAEAVAGAGVPAAEKVFDHWTKKLFSSYTVRAAVGLSAAAVIIFAVTRELGLFEPRQLEHAEMQRIAALEQAAHPEPPASEEVKMAPGTEKPGVPAGKTGQDQPVKSGREAVSAPVTSPEKAAKTKTAEETGQSLKERLALPGETKTQKSGGKENLKLITDKADITAAQRNVGAQENLRRPPAGGGKSIFRPGESLKMPKKEAEEFEAYLFNKKIIDELDGLAEKKDGWLLFLPELKEKMVIELVVNDIWNIYNTIVFPDSDKELKKEALAFIKEYKVILTARMGETRYAESVQYLEKIQ